jgi:hypothetical protein
LGTRPLPADGIAGTAAETAEAVAGNVENLKNVPKNLGNL